MYIKKKTKKAEMIRMAIISDKFKRKNKKFAVYICLRYLINFELFSMFHKPSKYRRMVFYHSSLRSRSFWKLLLWIFEKREWRLIIALEPFLNQVHLEDFRSVCEDLNEKIDAQLYLYFFKKLNHYQQRSCLFKIYEQLLELNEDLGCPKCELYSAYEHNFKKRFWPTRYFSIDDPEVSFCFLLILSVIYPEIYDFVREHELNKIRLKDKLCKILNIDTEKLKAIFKLLYVDMGLIERFYPEITVNYIKFFSYLKKRQILKYLNENP